MYIGGSLDGLTFQRNNAGTKADVMSLTRDGNVGIGTDSPTTYSLAGRHMELFGGGDYSFFHNNTTTVKSFYAINEASLLAALFTFSNHPLTLGTNNTERMRITSGGNVGIGTSSPQDRLDVNGSIRFRANTPNFTAVTDNAVLDYVPTSVFATEPCIRLAAIGTASVGADIRFLTGTSTSLGERMRITSGGNVLINTTSDNSTKLNVNGTTFTQILTQSVQIGRAHV